MFWVKENFSRNPKNKQKLLPQSITSIERTPGGGGERARSVFLVLLLFLFLLRDYEPLIDAD
jgi:hypothetical protein